MSVSVLADCLLSGCLVVASNVEIVHRLHTDSWSTDSQRSTFLHWYRSQILKTGDSNVFTKGFRFFSTAFAAGSISVI